MAEIVHQGEVSALAHQHLFQSVQLIHHLHQHPLVVFHALNLHLKLHHLLFHFPLLSKGSLFRDPGPYRDLFDFLGLNLSFRVPIYLSGSLLSMFWLNSREEHSLASHHPPWSWALPTFRWASNSPPVISLQCEHLGRLLLDLTSSLNEGDNNFRHQDASWREATSVRHIWRRYRVENV